MVRILFHWSLCLSWEVSWEKMVSGSLLVSFAILEANSLREERRQVGASLRPAKNSVWALSLLRVASRREQLQGFGILAFLAKRFNREDKTLQPFLRLTTWVQRILASLRRWRRGEYFC